MLTWVVVAESSRARIFAVTGPRKGLEEIAALAQPAARLKEGDLVSDAPGRSFDSGGQGRHAMGNASEHKHHEAESFARSIAGQLDTARQSREFAQLILVAPPHFLGLLRRYLTPACAATIVATVNKNLVQHDLSDIRDHLPHTF